LGRDVFAGLFEQERQSVSNHLEGKMAVQHLKRNDPFPLLETLLVVKQNPVTDLHNTFDDCIRWSQLKFEQLFNVIIRDLQVTYPEERGRPSVLDQQQTFPESGCI
jgi:hypothetical protein